MVLRMEVLAEPNVCLSGKREPRRPRPPRRYTALILAAFSVLFFALSTSALRYIKWHSR